MERKITITDILLIILLIIFVYTNFFQKELLPEKEVIEIPEKTGSSDRQVLESPKIVPIYIGGNDKPVYVDSGYKDLYEKTMDSLEKQRLYYEAIKITEYNDTLVDNKDIRILGYAKTRGSLLEYDVDYIIKSSTHEYTPKIDVRYPRLSIALGAEVGIPTNGLSSFNFYNEDTGTQQIVNIDKPAVLKGNINLMDKKGNTIKLGYDTEDRLWVGYSRNFKLIK